MSKQIKIDEKEYKLLRSLERNVRKWSNTDNGGKLIVFKRKNGTMTTDEETLYQDRFIRAVDKLEKYRKQKNGK